MTLQAALIASPPMEATPAPHAAITFVVIAVVFDRTPIYQFWMPRFPEFDTPKKPRPIEDEKITNLKRLRRHERKIEKAMALKAALLAASIGDQTPYLPTPEAIALANTALNRGGVALTETNTFMLTESVFNRGLLDKWIRDPNASGIAWQMLRMNSGSTSDDMLADFSAETRRMYDTPNAGGTSIWSECLSLEAIRTAYKKATLLRTEMEIAYLCECKITDYCLKLFDQIIGVSVTRLINFGCLVDRKYKGIPFCPGMVRKLLEKKLSGIIASTESVSDVNKWDKQILHVFCNSKSACRTLFEQYFLLPEAIRHNTFVLVTVTSGCDWIY